LYRQITGSDIKFKKETESKEEADAGHDDDEKEPTLE
jgi:hypothetical protein